MSDEEAQTGVQLDTESIMQPNQRRRIVTALEPVDNNISESTIMTRLSETSLYNLIDETYREDSEDMMDEKYLDLQLLRIITPDSNNVAAVYYNRAKRFGTAKNKQEVHYTRMYLCRVFSVDHINRNRTLAYVMQARNTNEDLWKHDIELRDNETLTIGTIFRLVAPHFVETYVNNEILLLVSQNPAIIMKIPRRIDDVSIKKISGNQSLAFTLNAMQLKVRRTVAIETTCSGNFCDKQRRNELGTNRACGCFNMSQHRTIITLEHTIGLKTPQNSFSINMEHFSSSRFSSIYLSSPFPRAVTVRKRINFYSKRKVGNCINHINMNGGLTAVGWYRRGMIKTKDY